ncbi:hypothetical protein MUK42_35185 [Musa troglodytarum]|uniref:Uncharacterized protein n=1 Tax=Musa troglodytarum TaxID=320322 RepID=A0A9E7FR56_9LILI|nr:hypothetical protein MUK42_35185 [Musa troglodytarum]
MFFGALTKPKELGLRGKRSFRTPWPPLIRERKKASRSSPPLEQWTGNRGRVIVDHGVVGFLVGGTLPGMFHDRVLQLQGVLEVPQDVAHGRPIDSVVGQALLRGLHVLLQRGWADGARQVGVDDLLQLTLAVALHRPLRQVHLLPRERRVDGGPRAQHLEEHHPEGVHVRLLRQLLAPEVLGVQVPEASLHGGADMGLLQRRGGLGEAEVGDLRHQVFVEQDVCRLDVPVDDAL